ncbi:MAG TPA: hypothetical protein VGF74_13440 [Thermoleophilaceae bacterium]|jgi:hypothetical protein
MNETQSSAQTNDTERPPTKVCPKCSIQETTSGVFCPHCGAQYAGKRRRLPKRGRRSLLVLVGVIVLAGAGTAVAMKSHHDRQVTAARHHREAAAAQARRLAAQRAAARRQAAKDAAAKRAAERAVERDLRREIVKSLEASVNKDAVKDVSDGLLDGPILHTECEPAAGGTSETAAPYSCLAVTKTNPDGTESGYRFTATANFKRGSYTWRLGG